jgi:hypothetical protein
MITLSPLAKTLRPLLFACVGLAVVTTGCSSTSKVAQSAKGSVYLEEVTDWSFEASHPAVIDQITMLKIVKGLYSDESQNGSSRMSAGGSKPMRVFSDEDAEFLAPLLAQGLSKAKPEQLVGFRVSSSAGSGSEPTAGSIYVQKGSIYLTIAKGAGSTAFMPESAAHPEHAPPYAAGGMAGVTSQVIDYHALAKTPMPIATSVQKAPSASATVTVVPSKASATPMASGLVAGETAIQPEGIDQAKEIIAKKNTEINMLRKESDWMKRELRDRDEEIKALKASVKQTPKKKRAEAHPTR